MPRIALAWDCTVIVDLQVDEWLCRSPVTLWVSRTSQTQLPSRSARSRAAAPAAARRPARPAAVFGEDTGRSAALTALGEMAWRQSIARATPIRLQGDPWSRLTRGPRVPLWRAFEPVPNGGCRDAAAHPHVTNAGPRRRPGRERCTAL